MTTPPALRNPFGRDGPVSAQTWIIGAAILIAASLVMVALVALRHEATSPPTSQASMEQARVDAQDQAAQSYLRTTLEAAKTMQARDGSYAHADSSSTGLVTTEPGMCFVGASTESEQDPSCRGHATASISATPLEWAAARLSHSGVCFWIKATSSGTTYGSGTPCTGEAATRASERSWPQA